MRILFGSIVSSLIITFASAFANFAVVDMKQIEDKSVVTQKLKEDVTKLSAKLEKDAEEVKKYIEDKVKKLEASASTLSREKIEKERNDLEKEIVELQTIFREREVMIEDAKINALEEINNKIKDIAKDIGEKKSFTIVLPSNLTVYFTPSADITNEVLNELNSKMKSVKFEVKLKEYKLKK